jgi:tRNA(Leu) C34 or U34 (ribose-2'-O)-methylase TrmL
MIAVGLVRPKSRHNIGAVLRAAGCFGADLVVIEGSRAHGDVASNATDTMKAFRRIPTVMVDDLFDAHPVGSVPIAVDLVDGAVSLVDFVHPKRAFYIFGPEDGTLGARHMSRCAHRVFIPTEGCLNLAATVNVVLYDRAAKSGSAAATAPLSRLRATA